jgi:nicotinamide-nucleotide amidase
VDVISGEDGEESASALVERLRSAFPEELFALDDERGVEEIVLDACRSEGLRLATAESCTGGMIGVRLTDVPGSSEVYLGGVIAYSDDVKRRELDVPEEVLRQHGAVSAETAAAMAQGARVRFEADVAVSVTGIAGPGGGSPEKPVGLVYIAVESGRGTAARSGVLPGDREAIRVRATALALHLLRTVVTQSVTHVRDHAL